MPPAPLFRSERLALVALALAAAGCRGDSTNEANALAPGFEGNAAAAMGETQLALLQQRAAASLAPHLADPAAARLAEVRPGSAPGAICGTVSEPGRGGAAAAPRPFVVTPEGAATISATAAIGWDDPQDPFPELWGIWCASPEELRLLQPEPDNGFIPPPGEIPTDLPPEDETLPPEQNGLQSPPETATPLRTPGPARPRRPIPPQDPNDNSFFNAVLPPDA
jgi:hypothetical protein